MLKSNQIYFSAAWNNTQYKSIDLQYQIPLLKEWMIRQADTNTIPNLGLWNIQNLVKLCRLSRLLKAWTDYAHITSLSRLFQASMQRLAKLNARQLTRLYCFCILKQCLRVVLLILLSLDFSKWNVMMIWIPVLQCSRDGDHLSRSCGRHPWTYRRQHVKRRSCAVGQTQGMSSTWLRQYGPGTSRLLQTGTSKPVFGRMF